MPQPNILFILIDDLGWRDLTCYGSTFYETPNLDRLAGDGMRFNNAYASCPVCSPTRASIVSGKYPARVGITNWIGGRSEGILADVPYLHYLPLTETSIATALGDGGYQTWHVGKWHLGDEDFYPDRQGFDVNVGGCEWGLPKQGYFSPWHIPTIADGPDGQYLTDRLTDEAVSLIRGRDRQRPFFMHLSHYAVHTPLQAPEPLVEKYRQKAKRLKLDQVEAVVEGEHFGCLHKEHLRIQRRLVQSHPVYAAMIENLDTNIGRVLAALDDEGLADDTMVIFTADNGGLATSEGSPTSNLPLAEGKGWNYEGGMRVCQMVRWPGVVDPGSQCGANVTSTDFYPTLLEAADLPLRPEQHCDGVSMMPLLRQRGELDRDAIFWHYPHYSNQGGRPAATILAGNWKLTEYFEDGALELYDLAADLSETCNLAGVQADRARELRSRLQAWLAEIEATIPQANPDYATKSKRPKTPNDACV